MKRTAVVLPGLAVAVLALAAPRLEAQTERYTLAGGDIAVWNLAGEISVQPGAGPEVVVDVARGGDDAAELRIETGRVADWQTLRVVYPDDRVVYREGRGNTTMRVADDGTFGRINSERGGRVRIRSSGGGLEAHADMVVRVPPGRTVAIFLGVGRMIAADLEGDLLLDGASASIEARNLRGEIELDTGSGGVSLDGAEGPVRIDTGSGHVQVRDVRGPSLEIDTGSGGVEADGVEADDLEIDTGSGRVRARAVRARDIVIDTGSGGVELELLSDVASLLVDTGSGGVTIDAPADLGARLDLETGSGGIDIDLPVRIQSSGRDYLRGELGDGEGTIRIDTGSGGIRIR